MWGGSTPSEPLLLVRVYWISCEGRVIGAGISRRTRGGGSGIGGNTQVRCASVEPHTWPFCIPYFAIRAVRMRTGCTLWRGTVLMSVSICRRDRASTAAKSGHTAGGRARRPTEDAAAPKSEQEPEPLVDAGMCGIQHVPVQPGGRFQSGAMAQQLQQWRKATRQYFEDLKSAGRCWQVEEGADMLLLRSSVLQKQQQAMSSAGEACCSKLREAADHSTAARSQSAASPDAFCHGNLRNALVCAIEVSCAVRKRAQELEEAYVAGVDYAELAAAAHSLAELFASRQHLLDLG